MRSGQRHTKQAGAQRRRMGERPRLNIPRKTGSAGRRPAKRMEPVDRGDAGTGPPDPVVSVIIPAMNEAVRIAAVVGEARKVHPRTEILVIANGCRDDTAERARAAGARVISYAEPLGHDAGRTVGAREAKGEILLFIDGDMIVPVEELIPFVQAVGSGLDIALNDYKGPVHRSPVHRVILAKYTLNAMLGREDLKGASMTAVPHAMSRRALERLGADLLTVPPKAQAAAVLAGLRVEAVHPVCVGKWNPARTRGPDPLELLVLGDHLEAIAGILEERGPRGGFQDQDCQRN